MSNPLITTLNLSASERNEIGRTVGRIKSVADFLSDAIDAFKDTTLVESVKEALPWSAIPGALAEAVPGAKFALLLFSNATKISDPGELGFLACTLAYQKTVQDAITAMDEPQSAKKISSDLKDRIKALDPAGSIDFLEVSLDDPASHEFVRQANRVFEVFAEASGYIESERTKLIDEINTKFGTNLRKLLADGETARKFEPFKAYAEMRSEDRLAYRTLRAHEDYQRWLYEEAPVLSKEPFALEHVYIDTDCGELEWGRIINSESRSADAPRTVDRVVVDAFLEKNGGRRPLLETVIGYIGKKGFRDAIIIQGAAGAGKSAFTLRLCAELIRARLHPIRIRLKDVKLERKNVSDSLPEAVLLRSEDYPLEGVRNTVRNLFLNNSIFNKSVRFKDADICPYVLILDAWDEISISATEGFKVRVAKLLEDIRSTYIDRGGPPVRVILTGRPSSAVADSSFLLESTPVLTLRPLKPAQLEEFIGKLADALRNKPVKVEDAYSWYIYKYDFKPVFEQYEKDFNLTLAHEEKQQARVTDYQGDSSSGTMAVLGLPLLAHLAVRLISQWEGNRAELIKNPTTLYRSLIDLTSAKGGTVSEDRRNPITQARIFGDKLRKLLHGTAAAMTVLGPEYISRGELIRRLKMEDEELEELVDETTKDNKLTSLMISFFFKGGHPDLGCEFLHKSYREYLFAECIVETLKEYGRRQREPLPERKEYWKDFDENSGRDHRHWFSRALSELLAPQWFSTEVIDHLEKLIPWEIRRATGKQSKEVGNPTHPLTLDEWKTIRDGLADIWDWWAEGVHLRPQQTKNKDTGFWLFESPTYAQELVKFAAPQDNEQKRRQQEPKRVIAMDAHLGETLFRICCLVHYHIAENTGWLKSADGEERGLEADKLWEGVSEIGEGPRKCQSIIRQGGRSWVMFAPSGKDPRYFSNYVARINSEGWRLYGQFPKGANILGADLREVKFHLSSGYSTLQRATIIDCSNLSSADLSGSELSRVVFYSVYAEEADLPRIVCIDTSIYWSNFNYANFNYADLSKSILYESSFRKAAFTHANLELVATYRSDFTDANLEGANLNSIKRTNSIGLPPEEEPADLTSEG